MNGIEVFLFGSALIKSSPGDIDLLVVYDNAALTVEFALLLRHRLRKLVEGSCRVSADVILLSRDEANETRFRDRVSAIQIFPLKQDQ